MSKKHNEFDAIWQDRDIRFDLDANSLRLRAGEELVEKIDNVEDTKGNNGDRGVLRVTNLRLIWHSAALPRINLSIGYNTINGVTTRTATSKLRGQTESLYLMARNSSTRFEFIFTCINPSQTRLFTTVIAVHRAYETSRMYRELRMRGSIIVDGKLKLLPNEQLFDRIEGVWNLSSDQGNLGYLVLSNVRVVWFAAMNAHFNVSIPYLQLRVCKVRDSKFGAALVIETSQQSGDFVFGFRVDPMDRLEQVAKLVQGLKKAYQLKPLLGVHYTKDYSQSYPNSSAMSKNTLASATDDEIVPQTEDDVEIDNKCSRPDAFAAYMADGGGSNTGARPPIYSDYLGVAVEKPRDGFSLSDLWRINVD